MSEYGPLLDAVRTLRWRASRPASGLLPGAHASRRRGTSVEFAEFRPYRQGDPIARVDWKLFARTDRAYLRLSNERTVLPTMVVLDATASMAFPAAGESKLARARSIAVALAAVARNAGDPAGVAIVCGGHSRIFRPRARRDTVAEVARVVTETGWGGTGGIAEAISAAGATATRVVLISDLLDETAQSIAAGRALAARGSEVYVVHVVAQAELEPEASAVVHDPEAPATRRALSPETIDFYRETFASWRADTAGAWRGTGANYVLSVTGTPVVADIRRIVAPPAESR